MAPSHLAQGEEAETITHPPETPLAAGENKAKPVVTDRTEPVRTVVAAATETEPERLDAPMPEGADDLKRISGIGPKLEALLNDLGVYHFAQIAAWTPENVAWVDERLKFKGRIEREEWIRQAHTLLAIDGKS